MCSVVVRLLLLFLYFSKSENHQLPEIPVDAFFEQIESDLKKIDNISEILSENAFKVLDDDGSSNWNLDLVSIFCSTLIFRNVSVLCRRQMDIICSNREELGTMIDAWSKIPYTGMKVTTVYDFGTYDECLSVDLESNGLRVLGKHCVAGLIIPTSTNITAENLLSSILALSYCVPNMCTGDDLFAMIGILPVRELINDFRCSTKEDNSILDGSAILVLFIFLVYLAIASISTIVDVSLQMNDRKIKMPLLTAFSFYSNGKKLFQTSSVVSDDKEQIQCFHGLKLISMLWITAGHYAAAWENLPVVNRDKVGGWLTERYSQYIATAHLAVDTFFYISGFLLAYQYFKKQASRSVFVQVKSLPMLVLQRYLRLTPSLLMVYLFMIGLARYLFDGPLLKGYEVPFRQNCIARWWSIFLYIENYYDWRNSCMVTLWYLSADMQLFLVAPLIMIPIAWQLKRSFKAALIELTFFCLLFTVLPLFTKLWFPDYDPDYGEYDTHSRLIDYFIGFTFGFFIRNRRSRPFAFSNKFNVLFWCLALSAMMATIFTLQEINMNFGYVHKAYMYTFMRPVWCLSLCWIVYSCIHGKGGVINYILSNGLMQCGGRLTYAMYLLHTVVILQWTMATRTSRYFTDIEMFYISTGIFIISWVISVFWTLLFESPIIIITKVLLEGNGGKKPADSVDQNSTKISTNQTISDLPVTNTDFSKNEAKVSLDQESNI